MTSMLRRSISYKGSTFTLPYEKSNQVWVNYLKADTEYLNCVVNLIRVIETTLPGWGWEIEFTLGSVTLALWPCIVSPDSLFAFTQTAREKYVVTKRFEEGLTLPEIFSTLFTDNSTKILLDVAAFNVSPILFFQTEAALLDLSLEPVVLPTIDPGEIVDIRNHTPEQIMVFVDALGSILNVALSEEFDTTPINTELPKTPLVRVTSGPSRIVLSVDLGDHGEITITTDRKKNTLVDLLSDACVSDIRTFLTTRKELVKSKESEKK